MCALCVAVFTDSITAVQPSSKGGTICLDLGSGTLRETTFNLRLEAYPVPFKSCYV